MSDHVKNLHLVPRSRRGWGKTLVHAIIVAAVLIVVSVVVYLVVKNYNAKKSKDMKLGRAEMRRQYADFIPKEVLLQDIMREDNRNTEATFFSNQNASTVQQNVKEYSDKIEEIEIERAAALKKKHREEQQRIRDIAAKMKPVSAPLTEKEPSPISAPTVSEEKQKDLVDRVVNAAPNDNDEEMRKILSSELNSLLNAKGENEIPQDIQSYATNVLHDFNVGLQEQMKREIAAAQNDE